MLFRSKSAAAFPIPALTVLLTIFLQHWVSTAISAQDAIPDSPAGNCLNGLLDSVNNPDEQARDAFLKTGFAKHDKDTLERRKGQTEQVRSQLGELTFKKVVSSSENRISALCETSNGPSVVLTVESTDESPYKITSVRLEMAGEDDEDSSDSSFDKQAKARAVELLAKELRSKYVFPKVGEEMASLVEKSIEDGEYSEIENVREFSSKLTKQLRNICHDKHLRVRAGSARRPGNSPGRRTADNHGFVKAEMLPGGIGYLKFNYFSGDREAQKTASAAMNFLANANALIFDLRDNGGGSPEMIAYLTSYLFEEPVHLNSFYNRPTDTTTESWTQKNVPGRKFSPETQVFVLTSGRTFSGAEEFSYNLKNLERGTIVGETTGGGAHPVMPVSLGDHMHITMPFARAINPITETNWEGVGVKPHIEVSSESALAKAIEIAKKRKTEVALSETEKMEKTETSNVDLNELAQTAAGLMADESFADAAKAFGKLTALDPENERAWFNYGYCLHASGELDKALEIHKKAAGFDRFAGIATYNMACVFSLKNQTDEAFETLEKAIKLGFGSASQVEGDSDFDNLRADKRYAKLIKKLKGD